MNSALADKLQVWGFDDDIIIYSDGSLGFCLEVIPIDVSCYDEEALNSLHESLCQLLNGLPSDIDIQFIQDICSGNESAIDEYENSSHKCISKSVANLKSKRASRLRELDDKGLIPAHKLKIVIRKPFSKPLVSSRKVFSKEAEYPEITESSLRHEVKKLVRLKNDIISSLNSINLESNVVNVEDIVTYLYQQWNPSRNVQIDSYDPDDIRNSVLFTDVAIDNSGFTMGDYHYRLISLKLLPGQTFASMGETLRSLPFNSRLFLSINVPDQVKEISSLQTQRRMAFSMVHGKQTGVSDLESEAKLHDLEGLIAELISQGEKVFHFGMNVLLKAKSKDSLEDQVSQTLLTIRELAGAEGLLETICSFDIFADCSFPNARVKERLKRIKTSNLADLLPVYGPWAGHKEPKVLLRSRYGSLVKFNPFSRSLTNANQIISGGSGSGKSFLTNLLLIQMLKENPQVFIVDIGGSYKKTCDNLEGQYISLGVDNGLSINPFDLPPGESSPSNSKIKFLLALIESMAKEDTERGLKKLERSELEECIQKLYENYLHPRLSNLKDALVDHNNPELKRIGRILSSWCGESAYGNLLDKTTNVDLDNSVICFDLKGLEAYPDLQRSCLLIISDLVLRTVQSDRERMKFLVFDECWALLEGEGASFIGSIFRTCRKYFMSCIAISQNIDDFAKSSVSSAIMTNTSIKWLLRQKGADKSRLQEVLELNDAEVSLVSSLTQEKGVFSEAFLMCEDQKSVVAIESTPEEYWMATTDPSDLNLLEKLKSNLPELSNAELIFKAAQDYPEGASNEG